MRLPWRKVWLALLTILMLGGAVLLALYVFDEVMGAARAGRSPRLVVSGPVATYKLEIWGNGPVQLSAREDGLNLTFGQDWLEIVGGKIEYNGRRYGTVEPKDHVTVTAEGRILVNGKRRRPHWFWN